jgi:hypothetical protein
MRSLPWRQARDEGDATVRGRYFSSTPFELPVSILSYKIKQTRLTLFAIQLLVSSLFVTCTQSEGVNYQGAALLQMMFQ